MGARQRGVALSTAFFLGLVLSLFVLGTLAAILGRLLTGWKVAFALGMATFSLAAGVAALFGPALRRRMPDPDIRKRRGAAGAFVYGLLYSVATITTTAGPLMLLLTVAVAMGRPVYGAALSLAYGIGRGLPFLILGLSAGAVGGGIAGIERYRRPVEVGSGIALMALAAYFVRLAIVLS